MRHAASADMARRCRDMSGEHMLPKWRRDAAQPARRFAEFSLTPGAALDPPATPAPPPPRRDTTTLTIAECPLVSSPPRFSLLSLMLTLQAAAVSPIIFVSPSSF
jgi:hypothetical protein